MSTNAPFELKIAGQAVITLPAERAIIHVAASSTGTNKVAVIDEVVTAAKHIENLLREIGPKDDSAAAKAASPLAHWNKDSLSSKTWTPRDDKNNEVAGAPEKHSATVTFDVRFKEFKALGSFGTRIGALPHVTIRDIDWILTTATEDSYRPQLRREAAENAVRVARHYCEILECTNLRPVELNVSTVQYSKGYILLTLLFLCFQEINEYSAATRSYHRQHIATQSARAYGDPGKPERPDELEFKPQEVKMKKDIKITFQAE